MKIKLTLPNNIIREYPAGTTLLEVSRDFAANYQSPIVEGIFNGIGTDLQKPVFENGTVDFITLDTEEGCAFMCAACCSFSGSYQRAAAGSKN